MRGKKFVDNVMSHLILSLVGVFSQILIVPLYIRDFGQQRYSGISIILSISAFVLISDYGIYLTTSSRLVQLYRDYNFYSLRVWNLYLRYVATAFAATTSILLLYFVHLTRSNPDLWQGFESAWVVLVLFIGSAATSLLQHAQLIKFQLIDQFGRGMKLLAFLRLMEVLIQGIALYFKINLVPFAIVTFLFRVMSACIFWFLANRSLGTHVSGPVQTVNEKDFSLLKDSTGKAVFNFTNLLSLHGTVLVTSLWIAPNLLFPILISRIITSPVKYLSDSFINGGLPQITTFFRELDKRKTIEDEKLGNSRLVLIACSGFVLLCILIVMAGPSLWGYLSFVDSQYPRVLILAFLCSTCLDSLSAVVAMLGIARNQKNAIQYAYLGSTVLALVLQYGFRGVLGGYSVPVSLAIGDLVFIVFVAGGINKERFSK
jgi:O-antigen/teichoic acid export membrane protein